MTTKTDAAKCAEEIESIIQQLNELKKDYHTQYYYEKEIESVVFRLNKLSGQHFPPSAEDGSGSKEPCVPEMCPSCEDRCGGTEFYSYCPCCENFIGPTPPHWYHGPRGVPVSKLKKALNTADLRTTSLVPDIRRRRAELLVTDIQALIAEVGSS